MAWAQLIASAYQGYTTDRASARALSAARANAEAARASAAANLEAARIDAQAGLLKAGTATRNILIGGGVIIAALLVWKLA